jgi:periplasmic protein TonB
VSRDGTVSEVKIKQSSENRLDHVVITAIRKWLFAPAMKNGQVVPAQITIPVLFDAESHEVTVDLGHYFDE